MNATYAAERKWVWTPVPSREWSSAAGIVPAEQAAIEIGQLWSKRSPGLSSGTTLFRLR